MIGLSLDSTAQSAGSYIYGVVHTCGEESYEGFIRWEDEEMYWHDVFNASRVSTDKLFNSQHEEKNTKWLDFNWDFSSIWDNNYNTTAHTFACFFGDIQYLDIGYGQEVTLGLKNGQIIELNGGSNDIGAKLRIEDYELGSVKINWSKVTKIDFKKAPKNAKTPYSIPLYGIVKTKRKGTFEGYIKWDNDERQGDDILNGESQSGDKKIPFKNIKNITKSNSGCDVTMQSGRSIYLSNSNDVDSGNRGVIVYIEGIGNIEIKWSEFKTLNFVDAPNAGPDFSDFKEPQGIYCSIATVDDMIHKGYIVFDLDEMWEPEMLDGSDGDVKYQIPFGNVKRIEPKNEDYAMVYLNNGKSLLLGNSQDVSDANDGIMVLNKNNREPKVIEWRDIIYIEID